MKLLALACAYALSIGAQVVVPALAADAPPNFSGTWTLDPARGENLGMMAKMRQTVSVTQDAKALVVKETSDFQGQKSSREVRYDLTGAPVKNEAAMGGQAETVARWDGRSLVSTWSTPGSVAGTVSTRTETRTLSADGKTMTVTSVREGGKAKPVTMVYAKQP